MALSTSTFSDAAGAVSDLFQGIGASQQGALKAQGLQLQAQSDRINAEGLQLKSQGDIAEGQEYDLASTLASKNAAYTAQSTAIQQMQQQRSITAGLGTTTADTAGAGFASSGSSLDVLRDSASQGALTTAVLGQQGLINQAGYKEQAASYDLMSSTAKAAAGVESEMATQTDQIADQTDTLAQETQKAADTQATGDFIGSAVKGAAAIATLFI